MKNVCLKLIFASSKEKKHLKEVLRRYKGINRIRLSRNNRNYYLNTENNYTTMRDSYKGSL